MAVTRSAGALLPVTAAMEEKSMAVTRSAGALLPVTAAMEEFGQRESMNHKLSAPITPSGARHVKRGHVWR